jgi:branched-chain amino acid transport system substrate-binding protein
MGATAMVSAGCGSSSTPKSTPTTAAATPATSTGGTPTTSAGAPQAATGSPIKIGFIYSATGGAASSYIDSQLGAQARFDAQNAQGGINGHPLQLVIADDASTPAGNNLAAELVVQQKGVFAVIEDSSLAFGGVKYLNQQGIPVTGAAVDGPEWAQKPYTNMFSVIPPVDGPIGGVNYTYTNIAKFLRQIGVTSLAGAAINSPSAIASLGATLYSASLEGIKTCYKNTSVPFAAYDFTPLALAIRSAGCDGALGLFGLTGNVSLSTAIKQGGSQTKQLYATAYDQNLLNSPTALAASQQDYAEISTVNFSPPNAAAKAMLADLEKYTAYKGGIPSLNIDFAYESADLMIKGLQLAGPNPSRQAFISNLRQVSSYDAAGLLPSPVTFQNFGSIGMLPEVQCVYFVQIVGHGYVPVPANGQPVCGNRVPVP